VPVRVLTADQQGRFRALARRVVGATPGFVTIAETGSGVDAVALAAVLRPDVVLLDARLPGLDDREVARRILTAGSARLLVLLGSDNDDAPSAIPGLVTIRKELLRPAMLLDAWERAAQSSDTNRATARRAEASSTIASS
jgi:DNA-binding NarL/FixJ family response regulator